MGHLGHHPRTQPAGRKRWAQRDPRRMVTRDGVPWRDLPMVDPVTVATVLADRWTAREGRLSPWRLRRAAAAVLAVGRTIPDVGRMTVDAADAVAEGLAGAVGRAVRAWLHYRRVSAGADACCRVSAIGSASLVTWVLASGAASVGGRPLLSAEWKRASW